MRTLARIAVLFFAAALAPAAAEEARRAPSEPAPLPQEQLTLERFGNAEKTCGEWSDGCAVCKRKADGSFGCSLTGIACQPAQIECRPTADTSNGPK